MEEHGALHAAVLEGFIPVVKAILQFYPDLEIEVFNFGVYKSCHLKWYYRCTLFYRMKLETDPFTYVLTSMYLPLL